MSVGYTACNLCGSSDNRYNYEDGGWHCFGCEESGRWDDEGEGIVDAFEEVDRDHLNLIDGYETRGFADRKIPKNITEFFNVRVGYDQDRNIVEHYYPITKAGVVVGYKKRHVPTKQFTIIGEQGESDLFGQAQFGVGNKNLVITEGELDAMSVATAMWKSSEKIWPVVSIPSAASTKTILNNLEWVRSFKKVIIMFDQDEAGQKAAEKAARIVGLDKAHIAVLPEKDPSDVLVKHGGMALEKCMWDAKPWSPAGIVNSSETWEAYKADKEAVYLPWPGFVQQLNNRTYGRRLGSITMFTSGTGSGKTSFLREDMYHILQNTEEKIGICSLEESVAETVRGFISIEMNKRVGLPDVHVDEDDERKAWEATMGTGRALIMDHQGSVSDDSLIDKMEYMALSGCKYIYLDHITIAVSETEGHVNTAIDKFMSDLLKICKRHDVWFGVVSHLRKTQVNQQSFEEGGDISEDDLRGSGSLKQISAQIIALTRNKHAENEIEKHTVRVKVLKDRFSGYTGWAGGYRFNQDTGRLFEATTDFKEL